MSSTDESNPYDLLQLPTEATEAEIRKAYRQRSLKVHPDRNPDNPDAARLFHELTQASELLLDPLRRLALDAKLRLVLAKKTRFAAYDNKRKEMVAELEERERAFKKSRVEKDKEERERWHEGERIKEEGRRMREAREKARVEVEEAGVRAEQAAKTAASEEDEPPALGGLDTTVRLKYALSAHPELTTVASLAALLAQFGPVDASAVILSLKPPKKAPLKPPKYAVALVPFTQVGAAFAAVAASARPERGLAGVDVSWVGGAEPALIAWLKRRGALGSAPAPAAATSDAPAPAEGAAEPTGARPAFRFADAPSKSASGSSSPFSSFPDSFPNTSAAPASSAPMPSGIDYESLTLMRLRQAERDRLEREIREREAEEA